MSRKRTPLTRKLVSPADAVMAIGVGALFVFIVWVIIYAMTGSYWFGVAAGFPARLIACVALFAKAPAVG